MTRPAAAGATRRERMQATQTLPQPWDELATGTATTIRLERLSLSVRHTREECWVDFQYDAAAGEPPGRSAATSQRFLISEHRRAVRVAPQLADRAVVVRPILPTELLPKQRTTLFISTALWARIAIDEHTLAELPSVRLSDTWFGPNTRWGELCYASQTRALLSLENVQYSPFRAITPVTIDNQGDDNLRLERINVPVPHLTLYCDGERFWTSSVRVRRDGAQTMNVQIEAAPRPDLTLVAPPRRPTRGGVLDRAVELLFA